MNRGGSWNNNADNVRISNRNNNNPDNRNNNLGFRVVRSQPNPNRVDSRWNGPTTSRKERQFPCGTPVDSGKEARELVI